MSELRAKFKSSLSSCHRLAGGGGGGGFLDSFFPFTIPSLPPPSSESELRAEAGAEWWPEDEAVWRGPAAVLKDDLKPIGIIKKVRY